MNDRPGSFRQRFPNKLGAPPPAEKITTARLLAEIGLELISPDAPRRLIRDTCSVSFDPGRVVIRTPDGSLFELTCRELPPDDPAAFPFLVLDDAEPEDVE